MNFDNSNDKYVRNNCQTKDVLLAEGLEQAWHRRYSSNIHSGVRVKIKNKDSSLFKPIDQQIHRESKTFSFNPTNHVKSILKRLCIESETSALSQNGKSSLETIHHSFRNPSFTSHQMKSVLNNKLHKQIHSLNINHQTKGRINIGIQTTIIKQIDRQTSCNIEPLVIRQSRSSSSFPSSTSKTSILDENSTYTNSSTSTETSTVSSTTASSTENRKHNDHYQCKNNRNNSAIDTDLERQHNRTKMTEFDMEKSTKQLSVIIFY